MIDATLENITVCFYCDRELEPQNDYSCIVCGRETCDYHNEACQGEDCDYYITCFRCMDQHIQTSHPKNLV